MCQTSSPDSPDHSQKGSPSFDIPKIDLMNEMKDILKLRLDTPSVDRSVSIAPILNYKNDMANVDRFYCAVMS